MRQMSGLDGKSVSRLTLHQWVEASRRVTHQIAATLELTELYPQIVRSLQESFDHYHHVHLYLLDPENGHLNLVEASGEAGRIMKEQGKRVEVDMALVGHVAATGQPVLASDVSQDSRCLPSSLFPETQSELAVPLILWKSKLTKEILGVIDVQNDQAGSLTEDDLVLLEGLSDQIAIAVRNAQLFKELGRRNLDLTALNAISASLGQLLPLDELLTSTLIEVIKIMSGDAGLVSLVDLQTGKMALSAHQGLPESLREQLEQDGLEDTLCGLVFEGMSDLGIGDLTQDAPVDVSGFVAVGFCSYLGTPLMLKGEAIGTLGILGQLSRRVTEADFNLMRAIGSQIAVAVQSAHLLEETQHSLEKLRVAHQAQDQLAHTLRELSVPVIQIWKDILVLPLVGTIDPERAMRIMEDLLEGIIQYQAEIVILDVTGVPVVDTSVANYILQTVKAAGMLGAKSILVGISGHIAQTMINIGINLSEVETRSNLQAGIEYALSLVGQAIGPRREED